MSILFVIYRIQRKSNVKSIPSMSQMLKYTKWLYYLLQKSIWGLNFFVQTPLHNIARDEARYDQIWINSIWTTSHGIVSLRVGISYGYLYIYCNQYASHVGKILNNIIKIEPVFNGICLLRICREFVVFFFILKCGILLLKDVLLYHTPNLFNLVTLK